MLVAVTLIRDILVSRSSMVVMSRCHAVTHLCMGLKGGKEELVSLTQSPLELLLVINSIQNTQLPEKVLLFHL